MSQKVRIIGVKVSSAVYLGDRTDPATGLTSPQFSDHPGEVMAWLCDGFRYRFNQHRSWRGRYATEPDPDNPGKRRKVLDDAGEPIIVALGDGAVSWTDKDARRERSFLAALPSRVLQAPQKLEDTEWFAASKRRATLVSKGRPEGSMPGFRRKRDDARFTCWFVGGANATLHPLGRRNAVVRITGQNPLGHRDKHPYRWSISIKVRLSQEIRPYTSVHVNWTKRTLVFTTLPQPIGRTPTGAIVGLDRGVVHHVATSDGDFHELPMERLRELDRKVRHLQKAQARARKVAGKQNARDYLAAGASKRYQAKAAQITALHAQATRITTDWQHKLTTNLVRDFDHIVVEDLNLPGMMRKAHPVPDPLRPGKWLPNGRAAKRGLSRSIAAARMGRLTELLEYKTKLSGVTLTRVNPAFTSQRCNQCGHTAAGNRESQAVFCCTRCGHTCNADTNAARNIRDQADSTIHAVRTVPRVELMSDTARGNPVGAAAMKREPYLQPA